MAALTDTKARNLRPEDKPIPHGGVVGLTLHPSTSKGRGKWVFRYVSPQSGKRRNAGLGTYPEVSIYEASQLAFAMRSDLSEGIDPLDKKKISAMQTSVPTLEESARLIHQDILPGWKNEKHAKQWITTLEKYVFIDIGRLPINQITPADIANVLRKIWLDIPETASRVKQRLHTVMAWGWAHGYCSSNPVDVVAYLLPQQPSKALRVEHQPAMPWREIPSFVKEHLTFLNDIDVTRLLLKFLILTACRSGEGRGMRWNEIDFSNRLWTIPAERMKTKVTHRVPLSDEAIKILQSTLGLHSELVFPSPKAIKPLSDMVLTSFLRRVKARSDTDGRYATAHGFRSSFRDWCSEHGYSRDLAERSLAHTIQNKVEAAYHRTDLLEQRRPIMEAWAKFVCSNNIRSLTQ